MATEITVMLDRPRAIRWTNPAICRNGSLPRPAKFVDLADSEKNLFAMCAIIWAALVDGNHPFEDTEDLCDYFATEAQQTAALDAITAMVRQFNLEKQQKETTPPEEAAKPAAEAPTGNPCM